MSLLHLKQFAKTICNEKLGIWGNLESTCLILDKTLTDVCTLEGHKGKLCNRTQPSLPPPELHCSSDSTASPSLDFSENTELSSDLPVKYSFSPDIYSISYTLNVNIYFSAVCLAVYPPEHRLKMLLGCGNLWWKAVVKQIWKPWKYVLYVQYYWSMHCYFWWYRMIQSQQSIVVWHLKFFPQQFLLHLNNAADSVRLWHPHLIPYVRWHEPEYHVEAETLMGGLLQGNVEPIFGVDFGAICFSKPWIIHPHGCAHVKLGSATSQWGRPPTGCWIPKLLKQIMMPLY